MMKCYCTNKMNPSQNAVLIAITRTSKIYFALFILIMNRLVQYLICQSAELKPLFLFINRKLIMLFKRENRNNKTIVCYFQAPGWGKRAVFSDNKGTTVGTCIWIPTCKKTRQWNVLITFLIWTVIFTWTEIASDPLQNRRKHICSTLWFLKDKNIRKSENSVVIWCLKK